MRFGLKISEIRNRFFQEDGFTLVELIITCSIMVFVIGAISLMLEGGYNTYAKIDDQITSQSEARRNVFRMTKYIRESKQIIDANTYELTISSDIDDDDVPENVHFYLTDSNTKLNQTVDDGDAVVLGRYVRNVDSGSAIFTFYDANGSEITDMNHARTASRNIKIEMIIDTDTAKLPPGYELESTVSLRNF